MLFCLPKMSNTILLLVQWQDVVVNGVAVQVSSHWDRSRRSIYRSRHSVIVCLRPRLVTFRILDTVDILWPHWGHYETFWGQFEDKLRTHWPWGHDKDIAHWTDHFPDHYLLSSCLHIVHWPFLHWQFSNFFLQCISPINLYNIFRTLTAGGVAGWA